MNDIKDTASTSISTEEKLSFLQYASKVFRQACEYPYEAICLNSIGLAYIDLEEKEKGLDHFHQATDVFEKLYNGNHPNMAYCLNNVGTTHILLGESEIALNYLKKAANILEKTIHPYTAICLNNIGAAYITLTGKEEVMYHTTEALKYFQQSLDMREEIYKAPHPHIVFSLRNISAACTILGKKEEGLAYLSQMRAIAEKLHRREEDLATPSATIALDTENAGTIYISFAKLMLGVYPSAGIF